MVYHFYLRKKCGGVAGQPAKFFLLQACGAIESVRCGTYNGK